MGVVTKRLQSLQVMIKFLVDLMGRSGFFLPPLYVHINKYCGGKKLTHEIFCYVLEKIFIVNLRKKTIF